MSDSNLRYMSEGGLNVFSMFKITKLTTGREYMGYFIIYPFYFGHLKNFWNIKVFVCLTLYVFGLSAPKGWEF